MNSVILNDILIEFFKQHPLDTLEKNDKINYIYKNLVYEAEVVVEAFPIITIYNDQHYHDPTFFTVSKVPMIASIGERFDSCKIHVRATSLEISYLKNDKEALQIIVKYGTDVTKIGGLYVRFMR
jgi:hypothetical protein